jgi:cytochrome c oxidase subunit 2
MGHATVEWVYIGAVVALLIWVGSAAWNVERVLEHVPPEAETIKVIGQQWFWSFEHADGTKEINELHVKKDVPYRFEITALDVNHNFNVPDFTILMDAVPGRINTLWSTFDQEGVYLIQCREYCGYSHYDMKAQLFVEPPELKEVSAETEGVTTGAAPVGEQQQESSTAQEEEKPSADVTLTILEGSATQGNPDYEPKPLSIKQGESILVDNVDAMPHTVTNGEGASDSTSGKIFDTSIINGGESAVLETTDVEPGSYDYYCTVHPYMTGTLTVE